MFTSYLLKLDVLVEDFHLGNYEMEKQMSVAIIIDCYLSLLSNLIDVGVAATSDLKMFNYFIAVNLIY